MHWKLLRRYLSDISRFVDVSRKYNGELVLMTNYFVQGVSIGQPSIKKSYWYAIAAEILKHCLETKSPKILFIGLGGNTSSLLVFRQNPAIHQTIVEIDHVVIRACRAYFHLDELKNAEIINADIFDLLKKKKTVWKHHFDVIVIDTFDAEPPYMLKGSHDPAFLIQLYAWIKHDGMFLFNAPVKTTGIKIDDLQVFLIKHFLDLEHRIIRDPRGYRNHVIKAEMKR
jgi:tRNA1(Val) A37 N6-methylase TrmN6